MKKSLISKTFNPWSRRQDLNLQPLGPEPSALPNCATSRNYNKKSCMQDFNFRWSGKQDLNLQPLGPKPSALPSCAISRFYGAP